MALRKFDCEKNIPFWRVVGVESAWSVPENLGVETPSDLIQPLLWGKAMLGRVAEGILMGGSWWLIDLRRGGGPLAAVPSIASPPGGDQCGNLQIWLSTRLSTPRRIKEVAWSGGFDVVDLLWMI
jgi:hypothetical protein